MTSTRFQFQAQRVLLTYKTHIDKIDYTSFIKEKTLNQQLDINIAHETGDDECPYLHSHMVIDFKKQFKTTNERYFDYNNIHPHIKTLRNKKAYNDALVYISKEDPENEHLKQINTSIYEKVQECKTLGEAYTKYVDNPSDALGIKALFQAKGHTVNLCKRFKFTPNKQWQHQITEMTEGDPDDRTIIWIVDRVGHNAKTKFSKYLQITQPKQWFVCKDMGTSRDAATILENTLEQGWEAHGMILDLPRSAEHHTRIYNYLEEVKDGFITSQKYQGKTTLFDSPHIIVMANWEPKKEMLSLDRWKIFYLYNDTLNLTDNQPISSQWGQPLTYTPNYQ